MVDRMKEEQDEAAALKRVVVGNFAYCVQEGHPYAAVTPIFKHVATPVACSFYILKK